MEVAIPMVLLGGMYVLSNQENTSKKNTSKETHTRENFQPNNTTIPKVRQKHLPNHHTPPTNFPVNGMAELKEEPNYYPNPNDAMNKYYNPQEQKKELEKNPNTYVSLTGERVPVSKFAHKNMQPFFGSKVKQNAVDYNSNENRLDNMVGSGSQQIRKQEQAPLFKPQENMHWAHGTPSTSDFMQSRMNSSMKMNNVKPFQEVRVGPGLDDKGGVLGSGGYNAGMQARDKWMDKTVDDLRVANNPKLSYGGVILPGKNPVDKRGNMGKMEKYRPDTYYINSPDRYFTTTGIEKAQTARAIEVLKNENRPETTREYYGAGDNAGGANAPYVPGQYNPSKRSVLDPNIKHITNAHASNKYAPTQNDHSIQGYKQSVTTNNRDITQARQPNLGVVSTIAKAVVAPLMDILRPTRKENVVGNLRTYGNAGTTEYKSGYVYNPAEKARTTIREMTENDPQQYNVTNQGTYGGYGYITNEQQPVSQHRDTTTTEYIGGVNRDNQGYGYITNEQQPIAQQRDTTNCEYSGGINRENGGFGHLTNEHQPVSQHRDTTHSEYTGNAGTMVGVSKQQTYDYAYNAHLIDKEPISRGRVPMGSNVKMFNGQSNTNVKIDKLDTDRQNNRMYVPQQMTRAPPSIDTYGMTRHKSEFGQDIQLQRIEPEMMKSMEQNPYALSVHKFATGQQRYN